MNESQPEELQHHQLLRDDLLAVNHRRDELLANIAALKKETTEEAQTRHRAGRTNKLQHEKEYRGHMTQFFKDAALRKLIDSGPL
jgi:hypothetical protein